jgi:hypothetical protein
MEDHEYLHLLAAAEGGGSGGRAKAMARLAMGDNAILHFSRSGRSVS